MTKIHTQLFVGSKPDPDKLLPVKNDFFNKPKGGLYTSTYQGPDMKSHWVLWCEENRPDWLEGCDYWLLTPREDARIYVIDSMDDLARLTASYPLADKLLDDYAAIDTPFYRQMIAMSILRRSRVSSMRCI